MSKIVIATGTVVVVGVAYSLFFSFTEYDKGSKKVGIVVMCSTDTVDVVGIDWKDDRVFGGVVVAV